MPVNATYKVFRRAGASNNCSVEDIIKPIIIVEGYDIFNDLDNDDIYSEYLNKHGAGDQLRAQGYDIISLNITAPSVSLQENALILENFINFINAQKSSEEELIIMGVSMGGILTRYALTHMESNSIDHQTRLFISFDSPHRGADVPLSIQALLVNLGFISFFDADFGLLYQSYISNGTIQLLSNHLSQLNNGTVNAHPKHVNFFNELKSMNSCNGYPQTTRSIAISNGSITGTFQQANFPGGASLMITRSFLVRVLQAAPDDFDLWGNGKMSVLYRDNPHDLNPKWYLNVNSNSLPIEHVPGGFYPWYDKVAESVTNGGGTASLNLKHIATFVSTISALDLSTNNSKLNLNSYGKSRILANSPFEDLWWTLVIPTYLIQN